MTTMTDCLVAFAVASGMSNTDAAAQAQIAMDAYLTEFEGDPSQGATALRKLQTEFLKMNLDSGPAEAIKQDLEIRIADLEDERRRSG